MFSGFDHVNVIFLEAFGRPSGEDHDGGCKEAGAPSQGILSLPASLCVFLFVHQCWGKSVLSCFFHRILRTALLY